MSTLESLNTRKSEHLKVSRVGGLTQEVDVTLKSLNTRNTWKSQHKKHSKVWTLESLKSGRFDSSWYNTWKSEHLKVLRVGGLTQEVDVTLERRHHAERETRDSLLRAPSSKHWNRDHTHIILKLMLSRLVVWQPDFCGLCGWVIIGLDQLNSAVLVAFQWNSLWSRSSQHVVQIFQLDEQTLKSQANASKTSETGEKSPKSQKPPSRRRRFTRAA